MSKAMDESRAMVAEVYEFKKTQIRSRLAELEHAAKYANATLTALSYDDGQRLIATLRDLVDEIDTLHWKINDMELEEQAREYEIKYKEGE